MEKQKISIVVPAYNQEEHLKECLDSILEQTYRDIEVIVVNDGSTDSTWQIIEEFAACDDRIIPLQKKNEGVSLARNFALTRVSGEYLMFVDSDDWIAASTCETAIQAAETNEADVVMWSYVRELGKESRPKMIFDSNVVFDKELVRSKLHRRMIGIVDEELRHPENADALCTVWGKLYRSEIIINNRIEFYDIREIGTYEDGLFNLDVFAYATKAIFLNVNLYHYRRTDVSSLTNEYNPNLAHLWKKLFGIMRKYINDNSLSSDYQTALNNRIVISLIALGINVMAKNDGAKGKIREIHNMISDIDYKEAISDFNATPLPVHWRLFFDSAKRENAFGVYILLLIIQKIRGR